MKIRPVVVTAVALAAIGSAGWNTAAAAPLLHTEIPASDCAVLSQIGAATISTLAPLQSQPPEQAAPAMAAYIANLRGQAGQVSSPEAKADIEALASALEGATGPESAGAVYGALGRVNSACS